MLALGIRSMEGLGGTSIRSSHHQAREVTRIARRIASEYGKVRYSRVCTDEEVWQRQ